ncbi:MAG: hypothetical protein J5I65_13015 [Aridibacter famidurans]|nr:hypothetical protein [Aridibacter famidurans]
MDRFEFKGRYSRRLPHIHPLDATFFITFRLAGSIPRNELRRYKRQKEARQHQFSRLQQTEKDPRILEKAEADLSQFERDWFLRFEEILDGVRHGPKWLADPEIQKIVMEVMQKKASDNYRLLAFCIMSNHVHLVIRPLLTVSDLENDRASDRSRYLTSRSTVPEIMKSIKGVSARRANLALARTGSFWERESYDRFVRDETELFRVIRYTIRNPVKAGLITKWQEWNGTYLAEDLRPKYEAV